METIIAAVISGAAAILVCVISSAVQVNKTRSMLEYRLEALTKQVEKHNRVVERVYRLEQREAVLTEKIAVSNHRIEDLEKGKP